MHEAHPDPPSLPDEPPHEGEAGDQRADPTADPTDEVRRDLGALEALLRQTRRALRAPALLEGALWYGATLGAVLASALLFGFVAEALFPSAAAAAEAAAAAAKGAARGWAQPGVRWILFGGIAAANLVALIAAVQFLRRRPSVDAIAAQLQRHDPELRNDLVAALQFGRALEDGGAERAGYSPSLARAHLHRTVRKLRAMAHGHRGLADCLPPRHLTPAVMALAGAFVLAALPFLLAPQASWSLLAGGALDQGLVDGAATRRPVVGDLDLHFRYPRYTGLQSAFQPFSTGHIETLAGTEVDVRTYPLVDAERYEMVISGGDEAPQTIPLRRGNRGGLEATMVVTRPGSYSFRATLADGTVVEDGIERPIVLVPDQAPEVTITGQEGQLEVSPGDVLTLQFGATDDFGIDAMTRVHAFGGDTSSPKRLPLELPGLANSPASIDGEVRFDLTPLDLQPKDVVVVWIEAVDNNGLSGPGVGESNKLVLRVSSPEDKHMRLIEEQQQVAEALLGVLADYLEAPVGERVPDANDVYRQVVGDEVAPAQRVERFGGVRAAHQGGVEVLAAMRELVGRLAADPLMLKRDVSLFEALYEQLYGLSRDGDEILNRLEPAAREQAISRGELQRLADHVATTEAAYEKGLLRLEDLLASQKMGAVKASAEEIERLKERLKELLQKYKETRDPELKKAILREVQRLRQRMGELLQRMQSQIERLPEEHVNLEALQQQQMESDARKLGENLQSIEELLARDDIDGALAALDEMTANLDAMTKEMDTAFGEAQPEGLDELDKELSELMDRVNDVESMQREVEEQTAELQTELAEEQRERMEQLMSESVDELEAMVDEQLADLDRMGKRRIPSHDREATQQARDKLEGLQRMLAERDMEQSLERARGALDELQSLQFSLELAERYTTGEGAQQRDVRQSSRDVEQQLMPRGQKVVDQLEEILDRASQQQGQPGQPGSQQQGKSAEAMQGLEQRQQQVREQADRLGQRIGEASEEFPMLEQQLRPSVDRASGAMGEAEQGLREGRTQRSLDNQRQALDELGKLKEAMKDTLQKRRQKERDAGRGQQREKVTIPEKDARGQGLQLRDEVLKGMKQEKLEDYESEIRDYYESLMQ